MMKAKPKSVKSMVMLIAAIAAVALLMNFLGLGTQKSATRIGFVSRDGWSSWSASYTMLDGWMRHTIRPKGDTLHVEVETVSGTISMEMKDADGNVVFSERNIETSSFEVEAPEKVVIRIEADHHKGRFDIR